MDMYLVCGWPTPLKHMIVGMMTFPIYGNIKAMFQTTNQISLGLDPHWIPHEIPSKSLKNLNSHYWTIGYLFFAGHIGLQCFVHISNKKLLPKKKVVFNDFHRNSHVLPTKWDWKVILPFNLTVTHHFFTIASPFFQFSFLNQILATV